MFIFSLLPLLFGYLLFLIFYSKNTSSGVYTRIRIALINAFIAWSIFVVAITESLSAVNMIRPGALIVVWSIALIVSFAYLLITGKIRIASKETFHHIRALINKTRSSKLIIGIFLVSAFVGFAYPPNNYDSLTYHMARVGHWTQNHNINNYPAHIIRQLIFPPFAEWVILHFQVLTDSDRFANNVQLLFFAGSLATVSLIIKELGGNTRQQFIGLMIACFIPMAIIQSNTTQNDIVVSFFVLCFVYFIIRLIKAFNWQNAMLCGLTLGLAWLTKGTGYLFTVLYCGWGFLVLVKMLRSPIRPGMVMQKLFILGMVPFLALLINAGHYSRNWGLNHEILGNANKGMTNEEITFKPLVFVTLKNVMNHLPVNYVIKYHTSRTAERWGIDINDPRYSMNSLELMKGGFSFHEDTAKNFVHTVLIGLLLIVFFFSKRLYRQRLTLYTLFVITTLLSALMFCILLKWQPWSNRLETALFMLFSVFLGMEIANFRKWIQLACYIPMLGFGLAALFLNERHPLLPITHSVFKKSYQSLFYPNDGLFQCINYVDATNHNKIGLWVGADAPDYPYYKLLRNAEHPSRIIEHIFVTNESAKYTDDNFTPDLIISPESNRDLYIYNGRTYLNTRDFKEGPSVFEIYQ